MLCPSGQQAVNCKEKTLHEDLSAEGEMQQRRRAEEKDTSTEHNVD